MATFDDSLLTGIKWRVLQETASGETSPTQLAERLGTTVAYASQQLKLLEAHGYLKKERVDKGTGGRKNNDTRIKYSVNKNALYLTLLRPYQAERKELKLNPPTSFLANVLCADLKEDGFCLMKLFFNHQDLFEKIDLLFYVESVKEEVHLLVITDELNSFRSEKSSITINCQGITRTFKFWSHTIAEFRAGLEKKEKYFEDHIQKAVLLYERKLGLAQSLSEALR